MPHNKVTFEWLEGNLHIFGSVRSMLYVGWRYGSSMWWLDVYAKMLGCGNIGLVEAHPGNIVQFKRDIPKWNVRIEDSLHLFRPREWDLLFWDHGIEHARDEDSLLECTGRFKLHFDKILYICPWGRCPNDTGGNPHEKHGVSVYEETIEKMEMECMTFNQKDMGCFGEIVAWWNGR